MKIKTLSAAAIVLALGACSAGSPGISVGLGLGTGIGSHLGLGTSVNIPISMNTKQNAETNANNSLKTTEEQIVSYFDAQGKPSNSAVKGGFYRKLISKQGSEYVVQDFYESNGKKRTDPYILPRERLMQFDATPSDGSLTTYAYNGNVLRQQIFQNNRLTDLKH